MKNAEDLDFCLNSSESRGKSLSVSYKRFNRNTKGLLPTIDNSMDHMMCFISRYSSIYGIMY